MNLDVLISDYFLMDEFNIFQTKIYEIRDNKNEELLELYNQLHPVKQGYLK
jgi:hypothetical protein